MNFLDGIQNFLQFVNDNWTSIMVIIGLCIALYQKVKKYISKSNEEKIAIAKTQIREMVLKMTADAEKDYEQWNKTGSIKRSQVIKQIFEKYPILSKVVDQEEIISWIDDMIDESLVTIENIFDERNTDESSTSNYMGEG